MNVKRFLLAALALFVFIFFYEWLVHGVLLKDLYHQTPAVWRPMDVMQRNMRFSFIAEVISALWLSFGFALICKEGGVKKGVLFGLFFGVWAGIISGGWALWFAVVPVLGWFWFLTYLIQGLLGGLILGSIYCCCPHRNKP